MSAKTQAAPGRGRSDEQKATASVTRSAKRERTTPQELRRLPPTPAGWVLNLGGLALVGLGVAMAFPTSVPALAPVLERASALGLGTDTVALAGLVLLALGSLARQQRAHARTLLAPGLAEAQIEEVRADLAQLQNGFQDLRASHVEQGVELGYVKKEVSEHRQEGRLANPKDALFRLAASLDQLGARLDRKIHDEVHGAVSVLRDNNETIASVVEQSRDSLQEALEHSSRQILDGIWEVVHGADQADEQDPEASGSQTGHTDYEVGPLEAGPATRYRLLDSDEPAHGRDELEVLVQLEEEPTDLGLLSEIDDVEDSRRAPSDSSDERTTDEESKGPLFGPESERDSEPRRRVEGL